MTGEARANVNEVQEMLLDLQRRLHEKAVTLAEMADEARANDEGMAPVARLRGKVEGVNLALSFIEENLRGGIPCLSGGRGRSPDM